MCTQELCTSGGLTLPRVPGGTTLDHSPRWPQHGDECKPLCGGCPGALPWPHSTARALRPAPRPGLEGCWRTGHCSPASGRQAEPEGSPAAQQREGPRMGPWGSATLHRATSPASFTPTGTHALSRWLSFGESPSALDHTVRGRPTSTPQATCDPGPSVPSPVPNGHYSVQAGDTAEGGAPSQDSTGTTEQN